jgi:hypothetical protein
MYVMQFLLLGFGCICHWLYLPFSTLTGHVNMAVWAGGYTLVVIHVMYV